MKRTARIALSGLMGALALVCLLLTVFPFATYALPALASVFLMPIVIECGKKWAVAAYVAVALLALLIAPDLEAKFLFVFFLLCITVRNIKINIKIRQMPNRLSINFSIWVSTVF